MTINMNKDIEITIDPETGLPALPENHRWEIKEVGREITNLKTLRVCLFGFIDVGKFVDVKVRVPRKKWYSLPRTKKERQLVPDFQWTVIKSLDLIEYADYDEYKDMDDTEKAQWTLQMTYYSVSIIGGCERVKEPTKENVLKAATKIYKAFVLDNEIAAEKERQAKLRADLVGTYPPKTLL